MRRLGRILLANLVMLTLALAAIEALLRWMSLYPQGTFTTVRFVHDARLGPWPEPDQVATARGACFEVPEIHINHLGMRDAPRALAAGAAGQGGAAAGAAGQGAGAAGSASGSGLGRVALLGDSFLQGLQVEDEQTVSRRLEAALGTEVLNFGVSSTGTGVQLMIYRHRVRPLRPATVVLLFNAANDVDDNLRELMARNHPRMAALSPFFQLDDAGRLSAEPQPGQAGRTSTLLHLLNRSAIGAVVLHRYRLGLSAEAQARGGGQRAPDELLHRGWQLTEALVRRLRDEVARDGSRFAVVVIADPQRREWSMGAAERLSRLGRAAGFPVLDLGAALGGYGDRWGTLRELSLACDVHWGPRGHRAAAEAIAGFLQTR